MRVVKQNAVVDQALCVACGCCVKFCPLSAVEVFHGLYAKVDPARCVGCGKCAKECPASIITIQEVGA